MSGEMDNLIMLNLSVHNTGSIRGEISSRSCLVRRDNIQNRFRLIQCVGESGNGVPLAEYAEIFQGPRQVVGGFRVLIRLPNIEISYSLIVSFKDRISKNGNNLSVGIVRRSHLPAN